MASPADESPHGDRFRVLFEHSSDAHFIFDETGITDCNDATVPLLKAADRSHVLSLHPAVLSPEYQPDGRRSVEKAREMDGLARARGYHRFEWLHRKVDGEVFPVEVTLNAVEIGGKPALTAAWADLTEIKRVEAELRQRTEQLEAVNRELARTNARLKRDLQAAARVQQALLPAALPNTPPVRLAWAFRPCEELAGGLLNIFLLDERHVGLYLLDRSRHRVPAAAPVRRLDPPPPPARRPRAAEPAGPGRAPRPPGPAPRGGPAPQRAVLHGPVRAVLHPVLRLRGPGLEHPDLHQRRTPRPRD